MKANLFSIIILVAYSYFSYTASAQNRCPNNKDSLSFYYNGSKIAYESIFSGFSLKTTDEIPAIRFSLTPNNSDIKTIKLLNSTDYDIDQNFIEISGVPRYFNSKLIIKAKNQVFNIYFELTKSDGTIFNCQVPFQFILIPSNLCTSPNNINYESGKSYVLTIKGFSIGKLNQSLTKSVPENKLVSYNYTTNSQLNEPQVTFIIDKNLKGNFVLNNVPIFYSNGENDYVNLCPINFNWIQPIYKSIEFLNSPTVYIGNVTHIKFKSNSQLPSTIDSKSGETHLTSISRTENNIYEADIRIDRTPPTLIRFESDTIQFSITNLIVKDAPRIISWSIRNKDNNEDILSSKASTSNESLYANGDYILLINGINIDEINFKTEVSGLYQLLKPTRNSSNLSFNLKLDCNANLFPGTKEIIGINPIDPGPISFPLGNISVRKKEFSLNEKYFDISFKKGRIQTNLINKDTIWLEGSTAIDSFDIKFKNDQIINKCGDQYAGNFDFVMELSFNDPISGNKKTLEKITITEKSNADEINFDSHQLVKELNNSDWGQLTLTIKTKNDQLSYMIQKTVRCEFYLRKVTLSNLMSINLSNGNLFSCAYISCVPFWYGLNFYKSAKEPRKINKIRAASFLESMDGGFIGSVTPNANENLGKGNAVGNFKDFDFGAACTIRFNPLNIPKIINQTGYTQSKTAVIVGGGYLFLNNTFFAMFGLGITIN